MSYVQVPPDSTGKKIYSEQRTITGGDVVQVQGVSISDRSNPEFQAAVDDDGAIYMRFGEGKPQLDAFGKLRTSGATILGDYVFSESILPTLFSTKKAGSGNATHNMTYNALVLSTDQASGDLVAHTSNTYHHYFPGSSHMAIMTVACGDSGKVGLTRRWGYFDAMDGYIFAQVDGEFRLQIRSSVTGSVTLLMDIPQSQFNVDKVDGTGPSELNIDLTQDNIYWLDIQWLGAGRVRFGTYYLGQRIVMHEYYHTNNNGLPHTRTGALPICYAQVNTSATSSPSIMKMWCAAVWSESVIDVTATGRGALRTFSKTVDLAAHAASGAEYAYVGTLSPKRTVDGTHTNRSLYFPAYFEVMAWDDTGADARCEVEVYVDPVLSDFVWNDIEAYDPFVSVEYDNSGSFYGGGSHVLATYLKGYSRQDLHETYKSFTQGSFKNYAESGGTKTAPIANVTQASTAVITFDYPQSPLREGQAITIANVGGMTQLNGQTVYLKMTGINTAELYQDLELTTPVNSSGYGAYTSGGTATGLYGDKMHFAIVVKPITPATTGTLNVRVNIGWKEINQ